MARFLDIDTKKRTASLDGGVPEMIGSDRLTVLLLTLARIKVRRHSSVLLATLKVLQPEQDWTMNKINFGVYHLRSGVLHRLGVRSWLQSKGHEGYLFVTPVGLEVRELQGGEVVVHKVPRSEPPDEKKSVADNAPPPVEQPAVQEQNDLREPELARWKKTPRYVAQLRTTLKGRPMCYQLIGDPGEPDAHFCEALPMNEWFCAEHNHGVPLRGRQAHSLTAAKTRAEA